MARHRPPSKTSHRRREASHAPRRDGSTQRSDPSDGRQRLQKVMAAAGVASRRECEVLIAEGRVEVDGEVVDELGSKVDPRRQRIVVDGEVLATKRYVYFAVNKPPGVVCSASDPEGRPRVIDMVPPSVGRIFSVGRLDVASEGLILLTNDGELANRLTHPRHGIAKRYQVRVAGHIKESDLDQLRKGVHLAEGFARVHSVRVRKRYPKSTLLEMVLTEGRNREIRRVLARVGHKVVALIRVAVGPIRLGDLPRGAYRKLTQEEVRALRKPSAARPKQR